MRVPLAITVAGAVALSLAACTPGSDDAPIDGGTFTMAIGADPGALDPAFATAGVTHQVQQFLYDSLVNVGPDGALIAGLASSWEGTTTEATFTLREGITCSDGTALTASDVAANINFVADPENQSTRMGTFVPPFAEAVADDAAGTVTVTSQAPDAFLVQNVGSLLIVCAAGLDDRDLLAQGAVGTGMFELDEFVADDHYTLTRRADYGWGPGEWSTEQAGLPDTVVLRVVSNETTASNLLLDGSVNLASLSGPDQTRMDGQGFVERELLTPLGWLWFNQADGQPGDAVDVRRALVQALNLDELGAAVSGGLGKASQGLVVAGIGPCTIDTVTPNLPSHDPAAATAALAGAGWENVGGELVKDGEQMTISFLYPTSYGPSMAAGAELIASVWGELGIAVETRGTTDVEGSQIIIGGQGSWDATFLPIGITLPSQIIPFLTGPTPAEGGVNFASIDNPGYLAGVGEASATPGAGGCEGWADAERALVSNVDVVPFVDSVTVFYGNGATFELVLGSVAPSTIRMTR